MVTGISFQVHQPGVEPGSAMFRTPRVTHYGPGACCKGRSWPMIARPRAANLTMPADQAGGRRVVARGRELRTPYSQMQVGTQPDRAFSRRAILAGPTRDLAN